MRITYVNKARKDQGKCGNCGDPLPAGSAYRWIKFRFGSKRIRCMKRSCRFRNSDMTTSDKLSDIYLAQKDCEDVIEEVFQVVGTIIPEEGVWPETIRAELERLADQLDESRGTAEQVAEGYEESAYALEEYFSGSARIDEINEKANAAREYSDQIEEKAREIRNMIANFEGDEPEWTAESEWPESEITDLLNEVSTVVDSLEMP